MQQFRGIRVRVQNGSATVRQVWKANISATNGIGYQDAEPVSWGAGGHGVFVATNGSTIEFYRTSGPLPLVGDVIDGDVNNGQRTIGSFPAENLSLTAPVASYPAYFSTTGGTQGAIRAGDGFFIENQPRGLVSATITNDTFDLTSGWTGQTLTNVEGVVHRDHTVFFGWEKPNQGSRIPFSVLATTLDRIDNDLAGGVGSPFAGALGRRNLRIIATDFTDWNALRTFATWGGPPTNPYIADASSNISGAINTYGRTIIGGSSSYQLALERGGWEATPGSPPWRGIIRAAFTPSTSANQGCQWFQGGSMVISPFARIQNATFAEPVRCVWFGDLGFLTTPSGGSTILGVVLPGIAALNTDGTLGADSIGFYVDTTGHLWAVYNNTSFCMVGPLSQGAVINGDTGISLTAGQKVRLRFEYDIKDFAGGGGYYHSSDENEVRWYIDDELILSVNGSQMLAEEFEMPSGMLPGISVVRVNASHVPRLTHWCLAHNTGS